MKKFLTGILVFSFLFQGQVLAIETHTTKTGYELYKQNVQNFCVPYKKTTGDSQLIVTLDESKYFQDLSQNFQAGDKDKNMTKIQVGKELEEAKKSYEKNMDLIYDCATNTSYYRAIRQVKEDLIKKSSELNSSLSPKIEQKQKSIEQKIKNSEGSCKLKNSKDSQVKLAVLNQATYETCKYGYYLEYLKEVTDNVNYLAKGNLQGGKDESVQINFLTSEYNKRINAINTELDRAYKVFPIVFQAYSDYENNLVNHILLELLEEDYKLLRIGIHKTLNPINQVVYKIKNAMRK